MLNTLNIRHAQRGTSMIEVLVTIVIMVFGLLGYAGLQLRIVSSEMESYQRAQALVLLNDMVERVNANRANASTYATTDVWGTGNSTYTTCSALTVGSAARDHCEWSLALLGSAEVSASSSKVGAMIGARGCISEIQAPNAASGVCAPGIYEVQVAWQGMTPTSAPPHTCGQGQYGSDDANRRVVAARVTVGLPSCT